MPPELLERSLTPNKDSPTIAPCLLDQAMGVAIAGIELHQIGGRHFQVGGQRSTVQARIFEMAREEESEDVDCTRAIDDHADVLAGPVGPQDLFNPRYQLICHSDDRSYLPSRGGDRRL
jgi:hypothetical protein